ncbi:MAG: hypothetical protein ACR2H5_17140 [Ktedonobacteraceae bacterium]
MSRRFKKVDYDQALESFGATGRLKDSTKIGPKYQYLLLTSSNFLIII